MKQRYGARSCERNFDVDKPILALINFCVDEP